MRVCAGDADNGLASTGASGVRVSRDDRRLGLLDGGAHTNLGLSKRHMAHLRLLFWFTNVHCGHCHVADSNVLLLDSWEDALICDI